MKIKSFLPLLLILAVPACSTSTVVRTGKDGETFTFHNTRALWKTGHIEGRVSATGMSFKMDNSATDSDALGTVTSAAVSAAIAGAKSQPVPALPAQPAQ